MIRQSGRTAPVILVLAWSCYAGGAAPPHSTASSSQANASNDELVSACAETDIDAFIARWHDAPNFDVRDLRGMTPLCRAVAAENHDVVEYLLERGADVNLQTADGRTPLHFAAEGNNVVLSQVLLRAKADHRRQTDQGERPIDVLKRRGLAEASAISDDFPQIVKARIVSALDRTLERTRQLSEHAVGLIELRERLIAEHRQDQRRAACQLGLYGTTRTVEEHLFYDEEVISLPPLPDELTEDLPLPYPQQEVDAVLASGSAAIALAELAYERDAPELNEVRTAVKQILAAIWPELHG